MNSTTNITSAQWIQVGGENKFINATIDGQVFMVPFDTNNKHYVEILKQVADGDLTIEAAPVLDEE